MVPFCFAPSGTSSCHTTLHTDGGGGGVNGVMKKHDRCYLIVNYNLILSSITLV